MNKKKALVIDDSVVIRKQMIKFLSQLNMDVIEAANGEEGLEAVKNFNLSLSIIFSDINMPKMDGISFLERIREMNIEVPIVMMTTESAIKLVEKAKSLGAYGWIIKPASLELLSAVVKKVEDKRNG